MRRWPTDAHLALAQISFLLIFGGPAERANIPTLATRLVAMPTCRLDARMALFSALKQAEDATVTGAAGGDGGTGGSQQLLMSTQARKLRHATKRSHEAALNGIRAFWTTLSHQQVNMRARAATTGKSAPTREDIPISSILLLNLRLLRASAASEAAVRAYHELIHFYVNTSGFVPTDALLTEALANFALLLLAVSERTAVSPLLLEAAGLPPDFAYLASISSVLSGDAHVPLSEAGDEASSLVGSSSFDYEQEQEFLPELEDLGLVPLGDFEHDMPSDDKLMSHSRRNIFSDGVQPGAPAPVHATGARLISSRVTTADVAGFGGALGLTEEDSDPVDAEGFDEGQTGKLSVARRLLQMVIELKALSEPLDDDGGASAVDGRSVAGGAASVFGPGSGGAPTANLLGGGGGASGHDSTGSFAPVRALLLAVRPQLLRKMDLLSFSSSGRNAFHALFVTAFLFLLVSAGWVVWLLHVTTSVSSAYDDTIDGRARLVALLDAHAASAGLAVPGYAALAASPDETLNLITESNSLLGPFYEPDAPTLAATLTACAQTLVTANAAYVVTKNTTTFVERLSFACDAATLPIDADAAVAAAPLFRHAAARSAAYTRDTARGVGLAAAHAAFLASGPGVSAAAAAVADPTATRSWNAFPPSLGTPLDLFLDPSDAEQCLAIASAYWIAVNGIPLASALIEAEYLAAGDTLDTLVSSNNVAIIFLVLQLVLTTASVFLAMRPLLLASHDATDTLVTTLLHHDAATELKAVDVALHALKHPPPPAGAGAGASSVGTSFLTKPTGLRGSETIFELRQRQADHERDRLAGQTAPDESQPPTATATARGWPPSSKAGVSSVSSDPFNPSLFQPVAQQSPTAAKARRQARLAAKFAEARLRRFRRRQGAQVALPLVLISFCLSVGLLLCALMSVGFTTIMATSYFAEPRISSVLLSARRLQSLALESLTIAGTVPARQISLAAELTALAATLEDVRDDLDDIPSVSLSTAASLLRGPLVPTFLNADHPIACLAQSGILGILSTLAQSAETISVELVSATPNREMLYLKFAESTVLTDLIDAALGSLAEAAESYFSALNLYTIGLQGALLLVCVGFTAFFLVVFIKRLRATLNAGKFLTRLL
jgi:hypothetical protein